MTDDKVSAIPASKDNRRVLALFVPIISCSLSAVVGVTIGQVGNLLYKLFGNTAACFTLPGFAILFLITFGLSFLSNKQLRKWLIGSGK